MKREYHAQFPLALQNSTTQGFAIRRLVDPNADEPTRWPAIGGIEDDWARIAILTQAAGTGRKDEARMGSGKMGGGLRYWIEHHAKAFFQRQSQYLAALKLYPSLPDLAGLPPGSWALQLPFTLRKPYISKDDTDFYILDNPVKKEWVFKVPCIAPAQWKGALRAAMYRLRRYKTLNEAAQNEQMVRLFGNVKEESEAYRAGCLHFYPTFFDRIGLEVINPHDRATGTGKNPIYFECVPAGTSGVFSLLYVPLHFHPSEETAKADLAAIAEGVHAMLTKYGFGAKTSSGYGVAEVERHSINLLPQHWQTVFAQKWQSDT